MDWEIGIGMYALQCIKHTDNENLLDTTGNYSMLCGDLNGKQIQKRGDICMCTAESCCWTAEMNERCKATLFQKGFFFKSVQKASGFPGGPSDKESA